MSANTLKIESRLREIKGRESRTQSIATRFTHAEEQALLKTAEARGQNLREWARHVLLREARQHDELASAGAVMTELISLQLFLTHVLQAVACGEQMTPSQYEELMRQVKANKHQAAREVLKQYGADKKEQPYA